MGKFADINGAVGVVTSSVEFKRILALPRRVLDLDAVLDVTCMFTKPGAEMKFWPLQSAALTEAAIADGLVGDIGCGSGKTLISLALPRAMDSKCAVLLVPPRLKTKTLRDIDEIYSKNFKLPLSCLHIVKYTELSSAKTADILETINPDLIIADEAHYLKRFQSARTKRFRRYMAENPGCRFVMLSGTMENRSIGESAYLVELALRKNSPLPRSYREVMDWAGALDTNPNYKMRSGVLKKLCAPGESVRDGYRRRFTETPGVVVGRMNVIGTSLTIRKLTPRVPAEIEELRRVTKNKWSIEGEEFDSATSLSRVMKQLASGFYLRWDWPGGEPDHEWLEARRNWNCAVRNILKRSKRGLDSPLLVYRAVKAGRVHEPAFGPWAAVRKRYRPTPPTVAVWKHDFIVDASIKWARTESKQGNCIIWVQNPALGERIAERSGWTYYGAGTDSDLARDPIIVCSVRAQGTGKNLQYHYSRNLFTTLPGSGEAFEQTVARTHRPKQPRDEVTVDWFGHVPELAASIGTIIEDAEFVQETKGHVQKVLYATRI